MPARDEARGGEKIDDETRKLLEPSQPARSCNSPVPTIAAIPAARLNPRHTRLTPARRVLSASIAALLFSAAQGQAQILWQATPANNNWNDGNNWVGGNIPDTNTEQAVFDTSSITTVNLTLATTIQKLTFNATAPPYTLLGAALTIDVNTTSATVPDAILVNAGAGKVTINNAVTFNDSNATGGNVAPLVTVGAGATLDVNGIWTTTGNRNLPLQGNGTMNLNAAAVVGTGQLQQSGNLLVNIFANPTSVGLIRSFSNTGGIRILTSLNKSLGLAVTGASAHLGRILLAANNVTSSGGLSLGGGSLAGVNTMDVTFGTDITGTDTATQSGGVTLNSLNTGITGTTAFMRFEVGTDDTLNVTGVISGNLGGYSAPLC